MVVHKQHYHTCTDIDAIKGRSRQDSNSAFLLLQTRMKVPLETFPDTLTVALTATIPISPENIHAYTYELKHIFTT